MAYTTPARRSRYDFGLRSRRQQRNGEPGIRIRNNIVGAALVLKHHRNTRRSVMRISVFVLAMFAATAGIGTSAQAQNYPWCAVYDVGDAAYNCGFVSREQCMATVSGIGGFCSVNTQYVAPVMHPTPKARKRS
jgi:hypothetical protein